MARSAFSSSPVLKRLRQFHVVGFRPAHPREHVLPEEAAPLDLEAVDPQHQGLLQEFALPGRGRPSERTAGPPAPAWESRRPAAGHPKESTHGWSSRSSTRSPPAATFRTGAFGLGLEPPPLLPASPFDMSAALLLRKPVTLAFFKENGGFPYLPFTLGRMVARGIETLLIAEQVNGWLGQVDANIKAGNLTIHNKYRWDPASWPVSAEGWGTTEAPRGALEAD